MISRWKLGTKLGLLVVLPVLVAVAVGGPAVRDQWRTWRQTDRVTEASLTVRMQRLLEHVETEASLSARFVATGDPATRQELASRRPQTDAAARAVADPHLRAPNPDTRAAVRKIMSRWRTLQTGRAAIDRRTVDDLAAGEAASSVNAAVREAIATTDPDAAPFRENLADLEATTARHQAVVSAVIGRGAVPTEAADLIRRDTTTEAGLRAAVLEVLERDDAAASARAARELRSAAAPVDAIRRLALAGQSGPTLQRSWQDATDRQLAALRSTARRLDARAVMVADAARADARSDLTRTAALAVGAGLAALVIALVLRRAIVRPLRSAATHASAVAARVGTDPDQAVPGPPSTERGRGGDEVAAIDDALREIETTTTSARASRRRADRNQIADLSVNLARRNQSLLQRQLDVIGEAAPAGSERERLATLHRLALRMRRDAASQLVLAGVDGHRPGTPSAGLAVIAHEAAAQVEHSARVDIIGVPDDVTVAGRAVTDLTHLLAELIENATTYSSPDTRVFVSARRQLDGIELTVSDEGIGIPVERLDALNELLGHPPLPGLDLSRSLGVSVVARLCERIGATVSLRSAAEVGTTASVKLPAALIDSILPEGVDDDDWVEPDAPDPIAAPTASDRGDADLTIFVGSIADGALLSPVIAPRPIPAAAPVRAPLPRRTPLATRPRVEPDRVPRPPGPRSRSAATVFELIARYESGTRRARRPESTSTTIAPDEGPPR